MTNMHTPTLDALNYDQQMPPLPQVNTVIHGTRNTPNRRTEQEEWNRGMTSRLNYQDDKIKAMEEEISELKHMIREIMTNQEEPEEEPKLENDQRYIDILEKRRINRESVSSYLGKGISAKLIFFIKRKFPSVDDEKLITSVATAIGARYGSKEIQEELDAIWNEDMVDDLFSIQMYLKIVNSNTKLKSTPKPKASPKKYIFKAANSTRANVGTGRPRTPGGSIGFGINSTKNNTTTRNSQNNPQSSFNRGGR